MKRIKAISAAILAVTLTACGNTETETIVGENNFLQNITESQTETETAAEITAAETQSQTSSEQTAGTASESSPQTSEAQTESVEESSVQTSVEKPTEAPSPNVRENNAEKQIKILEEYYNNTLKNISEYDRYVVTGVKEPKIYDLTGRGDVILLCDAAVLIEGDILERNITLCSTVDGGGNAVTEKIVDNTGGGVSYQSIDVKKCTVNNKFYFHYYSHGIMQMSSDTFICADDETDIIDISTTGADRYYSIDSCSVTEESYGTFCTYMGEVMTEPTPMRTDGEVSIYLQNPSKVNNNCFSKKAELLPPQNFKAEVIDGSNIKYSWNEVSGKDITYIVYKVKNGKYTKVLDTEFTYSYSIDGEKCDYCVTAVSGSKFVGESDYSNTYTAKNMDFGSYTAVDFIGAKYEDLQIYAKNNGGYRQYSQIWSRFRLKDSPYEFYGDLESYENGYKSDLDYVRGLSVDEGCAIDGDIVFDKNALKNLAKKYGQTSAVTEVYGEGGDISGVMVKISVSDNISVRLAYSIPWEKEYDDHTDEPNRI